MKRRVTVRLPDEVIDRLECAAERSGASKSTVMEAALERFLSPDAESIDDATLQRLDGMSQQLKRLEHSLSIVNETVASHARYHLTITPPLPPAHQHAACGLGLERFEVFAGQVERRVRLGAPLMRETMERVSGRSSDPFVHDAGEGPAAGSLPQDADQHAPEPIAVDAQPELPAAASEGGSNGGFLGTRYNRSL
jgi:predicted transcriptional regulator